MIDESPFIHELAYWTPSWGLLALIRTRHDSFQRMAKDKDDENHLYYKRLSEEMSAVEHKSREWMVPIYNLPFMIEQKLIAAKAS